MTTCDRQEYFFAIGCREKKPEYVEIIENCTSFPEFVLWCSEGMFGWKSERHWLPFQDIAIAGSQAEVKESLVWSLMWGRSYVTQIPDRRACDECLGHSLYSIYTRTLMSYKTFQLQVLVNNLRRCCNSYEASEVTYCTDTPESCINKCPIRCCTKVCWELPLEASSWSIWSLWKHIHPTWHPHQWSKSHQRDVTGTKRALHLNTIIIPLLKPENPWVNHSNQHKR